MYQRLASSWRSARDPPRACARIFGGRLRSVGASFVDKLSRCVNENAEVDLVSDALLISAVCGGVPDLKFKWTTENRSVDLAVSRRLEYERCTGYDLTHVNEALWSSVRRLATPSQRRQLVESGRRAYERWVRQQSDELEHNLRTHRAVAAFLSETLKTFRICHRAEYNKEPVFRQHRVVSDLPFLVNYESQRPNKVHTNVIETVCDQGKRRYLEVDPTHYSNYSLTRRYVHLLDMYSWWDEPKSLILETEPMKVLTSDEAERSIFDH